MFMTVANAFVVLLLITAIYAVLACMLFKSRDEVLFGKFSAAFFSMFQVCTGDGWSTDVVRPMFGESGVVSGYFLLNVVVAVLLDEFASAVETEKRRMKEKKNMLDVASAPHFLDPLLEFLAQYQTEKDLKDKIRVVFDVTNSFFSLPSHLKGLLYQILDGDDNETLTYDKFVEDWEDLMETTPQTTGKSEICWKDFEGVMLGQLNEFACRQAVTTGSQQDISGQVVRSRDQKRDQEAHQEGDASASSSPGNSEQATLDLVHQNAVMIAFEPDMSQKQLYLQDNGDDDEDNLNEDDDDDEDCEGNGEEILYEAGCA
ncbi:hypothetical protein GUITHDRAFT_148525 [Guillardia theta CCMP2712]|uniref:Ion transport domain-containing protein n=1 Tax=Guillardia theta (strain CCMP2712) TaxID=905079 RepID=L1I8Z0_GUITC|nr:hypothetical protein GUITHDRAFT_148525 [Guillardia theta CCMP2712]EKX32572.1 hypothetical protein GUITHDRAFT_148525 [Guillardia theta CCMP2712]|eukprot:XP_005819552.1 hypothetical protein GUITHDRAFT_148525 [Guillardia theta CCMP2712]